MSNDRYERHNTNDMIAIMRNANDSVNDFLRMQIFIGITKNIDLLVTLTNILELDEFIKQITLIVGHLHTIIFI